MLLPHNSEELIVDEMRFFDELMDRIGDLETKNKINLLVKTDYSNLPLVKHFMNKKYIDFSDLKYDVVRNIIFTEHEKCSVSIYFNFLPFSTELIREVRVTSDEYVLSCLD